MKTRSDKVALKDSLVEKLKKQSILIFARAHGLSVAKQEQLRRALKTEDAEYKIAKKTILKRAMDEVGLPYPATAETGEVGIIFGYRDEVSPAKVSAKFKKGNPETFGFIGGVLGGRLLSAIEVAALAKLPSRDELLSQLAGVLVAPIRNLMYVLNGNQQKLVVALSQIANAKD